jgi:tetratricopeptide (TPR) repeat protein
MQPTDVNNLTADATQHYRAKDFKNAARLFGEAASLFLANGHELDAAEMQNNRSVALLQAGDARGSYEAVHGTAQVFFAAGDIRRQGMAYGNEASALNALGRLEEADQNYHFAADALENAGEDQLRANIMQALAIVQLRKGKFLEAALTMQLGLAGLKQPSLRQKILLALLRIRP